MRGDPQIQSSETSEDLRFGATRKSGSPTEPEEEEPGQLGASPLEMPGERGSGRLEDSPLTRPEGARPRVTWETTSRSRTIRNAGQLAGRIEGDTEGPEFRAT
jgi:hypothetical protein